MQFQTFNKKRNFINFTVHEKPEMGSWSNENTYSNKIDTIYKYIRGILKNMSLSSLNDKFSFFVGLNFREFNVKKYFPDIWFRENGQKTRNSRKNVVAKIRTPKVILELHEKQHLHACRNQVFFIFKNVSRTKK